MPNLCRVLATDHKDDINAFSVSLSCLSIHS